MPEQVPAWSNSSELFANTLVGSIRLSWQGGLMDGDLKCKVLELRQWLPELLKAHPDAEDFYHAFAEEVSALTSNMKEEDLPHFEKQVALMLAEFGRQ